MLGINKLSLQINDRMLFNEVSFLVNPTDKLGLVGSNGAGKSTLLKCLYGALSLSHGAVTYHLADKELNAQEAVNKISFSGPYFELIEELEALEFLETYQRFRRLLINPADILNYAYLEQSSQKKIKQFSSGMKQRLRLSLALFSASELVILDEPTANLDPQGIEWYKELLVSQLGKRSLVVGSNFSEDEIFLCQDKLKVSDFSTNK